MKLAGDSAQNHCLECYKLVLLVILSMKTEATVTCHCRFSLSAVQ